jgi:hypothetical protein
MADFSKQWCEKNDPNMPYDFDILAEAKNLLPNHYIPSICEGYGFLAIGKDEQGDILLGFEDDLGNVKWESYNNIVK